MRQFRSVDRYATWLFAALGLLAPACGGSSESGSGTGARAPVAPAPVAGARTAA